jgi:hypothetical protein
MPDNKQMNGVELIAQERQRQIEVEDWTAEHDDGHEDGEMATAAACYASPSPIFEQNGTCFYDPWPWGCVISGRSVDDRDGFRQATTPEMKEGKDRLRQLVIAGALIAAEIDRIQRRGDAG